MVEAAGAGDCVGGLYYGTGGPVAGHWQPWPLSCGGGRGRRDDESSSTSMESPPGAPDSCAASAAALELAWAPVHGLAGGRASGSRRTSWRLAPCSPPRGCPWLPAAGWTSIVQMTFLTGCLRPGSSSPPARTPRSGWRAMRSGPCPRGGPGPRRRPRAPISLPADRCRELPAGPRIQCLPARYGRGGRGGAAGRRDGLPRISRRRAAHPGLGGQVGTRLRRLRPHRPPVSGRTLKTPLCSPASPTWPAPLGGSAASPATPGSTCAATPGRALHPGGQRQPLPGARRRLSRRRGRGRALAREVVRRILDAALRDRSAAPELRPSRPGRSPPDIDLRDLRPATARSRSAHPGHRLLQSRGARGRPGAGGRPPDPGRGSHYRFLVGEIAGEVAGYACWGPIPGTAASADLYWIAVHPDQGRGAGAALLAAAEDWMAADGRSRVYVETSTRAQYQPTRAFYLACGYQPRRRAAGLLLPGDGKASFSRWCSSAALSDSKDHFPAPQGRGAPGG